MEQASKPEVWCVVGTRPEVVKMAPVVHALQESSVVDVKVVATAQHREMLDQMMDVFELKADWDLDLMRPNQKHTDLIGRVMSKLQSLIAEEGKPDCVLVQGDTTTVMATALLCHHEQIKLGHVEAGLRSGNLHAPFPEEANRKIAGVLADYHFCPTPMARENLRSEGTADAHILVTGNTVIDALRFIISKHDIVEAPASAQQRVLLTCHRRESFGEPLKQIFGAIRAFAERHPEVEIRYPVHPNPRVLKPAHDILAGVPNIKLISPLGYIDCVRAMTDSTFIISDSGGIQEEATALGKKVLVLREVTERPEGVDAGFCRLVGSDPNLILAGAEAFLANPDAPDVSNVYGDGHAAERIRTMLEERLCEAC